MRLELAKIRDNQSYTNTARTLCYAIFGHKNHCFLCDSVTYLEGVCVRDMFVYTTRTDDAGSRLKLTEPHISLLLSLFVMIKNHFVMLRDIYMFMKKMAE